MELYQISERTLRYRLKQLKDQYKKQPSLLFKENKKWKIHYSISEHLAPERNKPAPPSL